MRKQLIILLLLCVCSLSLSAQDSSFSQYKGKPNLMYDAAVGYSTSGFSVVQTFTLLLQKFGIAFSFIGADRKPANFPDDYYANTWFGSKSKPRDNDLYFALQLVKPVTIKPYKTFLMLHAGPSFSQHTLQSFKHRSGGFLSFTNYDVTEDKTFGFGLSTEAKLLTVVRKKLAVECTVFGNINTRRSMAGIGLGISVD